MLRMWTLILAAGVLCTVCGCTGEMSTSTPADGEVGVPQDAKAVSFAVAWCENDDPAAAAKTAAAEAIEKLGCSAKGLIFYEYYPKTVTVTNDAGEEEEKEIPDADKDKLVLPAIRGVADSIPVIGCRARSLVNGGTMLQNTVAVMAIGGEQVACKAVKVELADDRKAVGTVIAEGVKVIVE